MPEVFTNSPLIIISAIVVFIWLAVITIILLKNKRQSKNLTQGISKKDLHTILQNLQSDNKSTLKQLEFVEKSLNKTNIKAQRHIQKIGFMRYNPFSDTGGNQSFCLSLLDRQGNGVVISSLHSRGQTRIYAKKIDHGKSPGYTLSKEERAVIKEALKNQK